MDHLDQSTKWPPHVYWNFSKYENMLEMHSPSDSQQFDILHVIFNYTMETHEKFSTKFSIQCQNGRHKVKIGRKKWKHHFFYSLISVLSENHCFQISSQNSHRTFLWHNNTYYTLWYGFMSLTIINASL